MATVIEPESTAITQKPIAAKAVLFAVTEATIETKLKKHLALKVNGIADKEGLAIAKAARMETVKARTSIEATRVEAKAEYLEAGRRVDAAAKQLQALIAPIEKHLDEQIDAVKREQERLEQEAADKFYAVRKQRLLDAGGTLDEGTVRSMSEAVFEVAVANMAEQTRLRKEAEAREAAERAERDRLQREEAERNRIEAERLKAEREAFQKQQAEADAERKRLQAIEDEKRAAERAELDRQQAEIKAERDRLEKIERDRVEAERLEQARKDAAEKARVETEARLKREAEAAEAKRVADEAAAKRAEELKPLKDKIGDFAAKVQLLPLPDGLSQLIADQINRDLLVCANSIRNIAETLA